MLTEIEELKKEIEELKKEKDSIVKTLDYHNQIFTIVYSRLKVLESTNKIVEILEKVI